MDNYYTNKINQGETIKNELLGAMTIAVGPGTYELIYPDGNSMERFKMYWASTITLYPGETLKKVL